MTSDRPTWEQRRDQIRQRLAAIQVRLEELRARRREMLDSSGERLASAQRHLIASQAAADRAAAASARAFRTSAEAHERAAFHHERSAETGSADKDSHEREAAAHRAAAIADMRQAGATQPGVTGENDARGSDASHALRRLVWLKTVTSIQPELWIDRAAAAVAFYQAAFGATVQHQVGEGDDIVAQLAIGDASFWVSPGGADGPRFSPRAIGGATGRMLLVADDPDAMFSRAVSAGAAPTGEMTDEHGWRVGRIVDPFGHEWEIGRPLGPWPPA